MFEIAFTPSAFDDLSLFRITDRRIILDGIEVQAADGREYVLAEIDSFDREIELTRQNEALMQLLDQRGKERRSISLATARERLLAH